ncbi:hypothetical protein EW146_g4253 [Bondarzewia mesenterica]|uniref:Uncharacterized protein n=1 Tax=Bondarzewia mesenterica TaxID=1095465 RepID=A0A4S4LV10_9AGAM|nr:hypothetical protein EW146_g4253 [Bondarzewia mesenterica]
MSLKIVTSHIKRIAHGIPEDKWDDLLEEITRVMKPGAAFEVHSQTVHTWGKILRGHLQMIEEDLFFPGKSAESPPSSRPASPAYLPTPPPSSEDHSTQRPSFQKRHTAPTRSTSVSTLSTSGTSTSSSQAPNTSATSAASSSFSPSGLPAVPQGIAISPSLPATTTFAPFLLRSLPKPPSNPRDHSMLEYVYTEMHASRFINLSPLSLLANSLPLYFKDVRTHSPIMFMFPPPSPCRANRQYADTSNDYDISDSESDSDESLPRDSRDTYRPSRTASTSVGNQTQIHRQTHSKSTKSKPSTDLTTSSQPPSTSTWINGREILNHSQHYVVLDGSRASAFSPMHHKAGVSSPSLHSRMTTTLSPSTFTSLGLGGVSPASSETGSVGCLRDVRRGRGTRVTP